VREAQAEGEERVAAVKVHSPLPLCNHLAHSNIIVY